MIHVRFSIEIKHKNAIVMSIVFQLLIAAQIIIDVQNIEVWISFLIVFSYLNDVKSSTSIKCIFRYVVTYVRVYVCSSSKGLLFPQYFVLSAFHWQLSQKSRKAPVNNYIVFWKLILKFTPLLFNHLQCDSGLAIDCVV